ncbi:hypothetical protein EGW08_011024 [Elysia chlorotica]|uniref:Uncharacterized protein n=1 Tax=Elysia chlorotica TaxID=188477 RepID=A0A3S1BDS6_ELYCH|nr:hypothetical protein EGW08_011024 [Elysia chlorotica]
MTCEEQRKIFFRQANKMTSRVSVWYMGALCVLLMLTSVDQSEARPSQTNQKAPSPHCMRMCKDRCFQLTYNCWLGTCVLCFFSCPESCLPTHQEGPAHPMQAQTFQDFFPQSGPEQNK